MTEELFTQIKKELSEVKVENVEKIKSTWLIFSIGNKQYALAAGNVKEILREAQVFPLPFVPDYIKGVVNRYGDPYAVIDPAMLINEQEQNTSLFIVLNDNSNSHSCFQISEVKDFFTAGEDSIVHFAQSEMSDFFEGTLIINNSQVLVLKPEAFLEKVSSELVS